jgi:hypothetical protein
MKFIIGRFYAPKKATLGHIADEFSFAANCNHDKECFPENEFFVNYLCIQSRFSSYWIL